MAALDNAITTLARYKAFAEITGTTKDTILTYIILSVTKFIQSYTGRKFYRQTITNEMYDGRGTDKLLLKNYPIISGQTLTVQQRSTGQSDNDWETIDSSEYWIKYDAGIIQFNHNTVPGVQNYRVNYVAGFYMPEDSEYEDGTDNDYDLPYDLELAAFDLISYEYNRRKNKGVSSSTVGDVSITYSKVLAGDSELKATLDRYRKPRYS